MSNAETVLYTLLSDTESIEFLAKEGFGSIEVSQIVPTKAARPIVRWCVEQFFNSGRRTAPSNAMIRERWADDLEQLQIDLGDGTETDDIRPVVDQLRTTYLMHRAQRLMVDSSTKLADAAADEKLSTFNEIVHDYYKLARRLESRSQQQTALAGIEAAAMRYASRADSGIALDGLTFGLPLIDEYVSGIHPGEIALWAGETASGKSWITALALWSNFWRGRRVVLFTLENDVDMTFDRLICMGAHIDYKRWQDGRCTPEELQEFETLWTHVENAPNTFIVEQPPEGECTVHDMVRKAFSYGADDLIIDQLTFIDTVDSYSKTSDQIREIMRDLKRLIGNGTEKITCMLMHQINREGADFARKNGGYLVKHMSYGAEVERTAHFVFVIYQSEMDKINEDAQFQMLKGRRVAPGARWAAVYRLGKGDIRVTHQIHNDVAPPDERPQRGPRTAEGAEDTDEVSVEEAVVPA